MNLSNVKDQNILSSLQNIEKLEKSISLLSSLTLKSTKSRSPKIVKINFKSPAKNFKKIKQTNKKLTTPNKIKPCNQSKINIHDQKNSKCSLHKHQSCIACCEKKCEAKPKLRNAQSPNKSILKERSFCVIEMEEDENTKSPDAKIQRFKTVLQNQLEEINKSLYKSKFKLEAAKSLGSLKSVVKANFQTFKERYSKLPNQNSMVGQDMSTTCFKNYSFQQ